MRLPDTAISVDARSLDGAVSEVAVRSLDSAISEVGTRLRGGPETGSGQGVAAFI
jgi:hypothetical protein